MSSIQFQQAKRNIASNVNPAERFNAAKRVVTNGCLNTSQLIEIMSFFGEDADRLDLAMKAYPSLMNKQDSYELLNSFAYFSTAFVFYDFIRQDEPTGVNPSTPVIQAPVQVNFPALNYPDHSNYQGLHKCAYPLAATDFTVFVREIAAKPSEAEKYDAAMNLAGTVCFTTTQAMKLSTLLQLEQNRYNLLVRAYEAVYDEGNFDASTQVFAHIPNKQMLTDYIANQRATVGMPVPVPCELSEQTFNRMKSSFALEGSSSSRMQIVKNQLPNYNCYVSSQIKQIVSLFNSGSDKLEISKFAYKYVTDKNNYYFEISPLFNSSMDRQALSNYIAANP
ncbi:MAG: DUF4476 domain-containing protein [Bacteroidetes bacterium]|nr:DUF4476 domain-containing protein [Bacteroidota bacterium]